MTDRYRSSSGRSVSQFSQLPGCPQVVVSHAMFMFPIYRGSGYAEEELQDRIKHARELGYDAIVCTVNIENKGSLIPLERAGFKRMLEFKSQASSHNVVMMGLVL